MSLSRLIPLAVFLLSLSAMNWASCGDCARDVVQKRYGFVVADSTPCRGAIDQCHCQPGVDYEPNKTFGEPLNPNLSGDLSEHSDAELKALLRPVLFRELLGHPFKDRSHLNSGRLACSLSDTGDTDWSITTTRIDASSEVVNKFAAELKASAMAKADLDDDMKVQLGNAIEAATLKSSTVKSSVSLVYFHAFYSASADGLMSLGYMEDCIGKAAAQGLPIVTGVSGLWILASKQASAAFSSAEFQQKLDVELDARKIPRVKASAAVAAAMSTSSQTTAGATSVSSDVLDFAWMRFSQVRGADGGATVQSRPICQVTAQDFSWSQVASATVASCSNLVPNREYAVTYTASLAPTKSNWLEYSFTGQGCEKKMKLSDQEISGTKSVALGCRADDKGRLSFSLSGTMCSPSGSTCELQNHAVTIR